MTGYDGMQGIDKAHLCTLKHVYMQHSTPQGATCNAIADIAKDYTPESMLQLLSSRAPTLPAHRGINWSSTVQARFTGRVYLVQGREPPAVH